MSKKICFVILVACLVFSLFFISNVPVSAIANATTFPKYGVNCRISGDYPLNTSTINDIRQGGRYWVRVSLTDPSAIPAVQSYMQNEDVLWCLPQYGWDVGQSWQQYVQNVVNSVSSNVQAWEIGNEPDQTYSLTPQQYVTMLQQAYTIIKARNPNALIVGPAVCTWAGGVNFISSIKSLGAFNYLDAISVHYYPPNADTGLKSIEATVGSKPIWVTETGYSTYESSESAQNTFYQTNINPSNGFLGADSAIQVIIVYELNDYSYPTEFGDGFGLTYGPYNNYAYKQGYATFKSYLSSDTLISTPITQPTVNPTSTIYNTTITPKPMQTPTIDYTNFLVVIGIITFSTLIGMLFFVAIKRKHRLLNRSRSKPDI